MELAVRLRSACPRDLVAILVDAAGRLRAAAGGVV
jgi:hypothetical protein